MKWSLALAASFLFGLWMRGHYHLVAHEAPPALDGAAVARGERIFLHQGCYGCHAVSQWPALPPPGPALDHARSKLSREFIYTWLTRPQAYRPELRVASHFLRDESEAGVRALTTFVIRRSLPWSAPKVVAHPGGAGLYDKLACAACHGEREAGFANLGAKTNLAWLSGFLRKPAAYDRQTTMPDFHLSAPDADALAQTLSLQNDGIFEVRFPHLTRLTVDAVDGALNAEGVAEVGGAPLEQALLIDKEVALGERRYAQAGCGGCHQLAGSAASTSTARDAMLASPDAVLAAMARPGIHVQFALSPEEQSDVAAFLRSPRREKFSPLEAGEFRMRTLGCAACHEGGATRAPALLNEHARVKPEWLFSYLAKPGKAAKTDAMVMPSFALNDDALNDMVAALSGPRVAFESAPEARGTLAECRSCHDAPALAAMRARFRPSWVASYLATHPSSHDLETARGLAGVLFAGSLP